MRSLVIWAIAVVCFAAAGTPALAQDESWEVLADSTLDGHDGYLVRIVAPGEGSATMFVFEESGKYRVYAARDGGSSIWSVLPGEQYYCESTSMNINDTWRHLDDDGEEAQATVVDQQQVTTGAGTFTAYKVNVVRVSAPSTVTQILWFASGVGLVRQIDLYSGPFPDTWQSDLQNYSITGGSGFFPLAAGNQWQFAEITNPVKTSSWSGIKSAFE